MKLLFDQKPSPKLTSLFTESFEEVRHTQEIGFDKGDDADILEFAKTNQFTVVTKDGDFNELISLFGFPPKIIWIRRGNCTTEDIVEIIEANLDKIHSFGDDSTNGILTLF